jgi:uncharacterized membrane protein YhhN
MRDFIIYFIIGLLTDWLVTIQTLTVVKRQPWRSAAYTLVLTVVSLAVLDRYIEGRSWLLIAGYAVGNAFGTFLGVVEKKKPPSP